jgi:hypothetical protein
MGVVAVEDLDIDAGLGHATRQAPELPRFFLIQAHGNNLPIRHDLDPGVGQRSTRAVNVIDEEMGKAAPGNRKCTASFEAHARSAQGFAHLCNRPRSIGK